MLFYLLFGLYIFIQFTFTDKSLSAYAVIHVILYLLPLFLLFSFFYNMLFPSSTVCCVCIFSYLKVSLDIFYSCSLFAIRTCTFLSTPSSREHLLTKQIKYYVCSFVNLSTFPSFALLTEVN